MTAENSTKESSQAQLLKLKNYINQEIIGQDILVERMLIELLAGEGKLAIVPLLVMPPEISEPVSLIPVNAAIDPELSMPLLMLDCLISSPTLFPKNPEPPASVPELFTPPASVELPIETPLRLPEMDPGSMISKDPPINPDAVNPSEILGLDAPSTR